MKRNMLRIFASLVILSLLLPSSSIQARQTIASTDVPEQEVVSDVDLDLPEGLTSSVWQSIQNQIMSNLSQQSYLKASNTDAEDYLGLSVAVSNNTIVVGALCEDSAATGVNGDQNDNSVEYSGAAYVFVRDGTTWTQQAYLKASNTDAGDSFGGSVAVSNDTIVVGASGESSDATGVNGDQNDNSADGAGAAYVFVRDGTTWTQQAYLKASNTDADDGFGVSVAVFNDTIVVVAGGEDSTATGVNGDQNNNSAELSGAAYVFVRDGTTWTQQAYLKASNTDAWDEFGRSVAISNDTIVVCAPWEDSAATGVNGNQNDNSVSGAGAAYVFVRNGITWIQQAYLKASNTDAEDLFGTSVAVFNDTIVVVAGGEDSAATGVNGNQNDNSVSGAGAAYVFVRDGTIWTQQAYLKASNTDWYDYFGFSVAVSNDTIVVTAISENSAATGVNGDQNDNSAGEAGAAYVFVRDGTTWTQQAYLKASNTDAGDSFGGSVAVSNDTIVVGASGESSDATGVNGDQNDNSADGAGAVYVFVRDPIVPPIEPSWLLMYYVAGDNNLVEALHWEIQNIESRRNPNVDIAIFFGSPFLFNYYKFLSNDRFDDYEEFGNLNSGDPQTLIDFIQWARSKSTASNQALVISDHGHGLNGVADDYQSDDNISSKELHEVLIEEGPVDVLYSNTCLTANMEFMWELRGLTDYYIASESKVWGPQRHSYISEIVDSTTVYDLSYQMAKAYEDDWMDEKTPSTISVIDMAYIQDMFVQTNALAKAIWEAPLSAQLQAWDILRSSDLQRFDEDNHPGIDEDDTFVDLFHFASLVKPIPELTWAATTLLSTESLFVRYKERWSGYKADGVEWVHDNARGVSIALPVNPLSFYDEEWLDFATGADWSFVIPGIQTSTQVEGYYWGPMVSDLIFNNNPEGEDEPLPPDPLPMLIEYRFYIPMIQK